jgi:hypothetical protein
MSQRDDAPLSEAIAEVENAVQDTEASGRPAAHLYGAWQNLKHAILAQRSETVPSQNDLRECADFWAHYSSINEGAQDDINDERQAWLAKMDAWAGRSAPTPNKADAK